MQRAFSSFLGIKIPQEFCEQRTLANIRLAVYLCYGIVLLSTLLLFNDYGRYISGKWAEFPPMAYITYSHVGYLFVGLSFLAWKIHFSEKATPKQRNYAIMGLINGMLLFCITITVAAQHLHGQVTMYVLGVVVVAFLIVQSPKEMILNFLGMWLLTMIGLTFFGNPVFYSATSINLSAVVVVSAIVSYYMFQVQMSSFTKSKLIDEQRLKLIAAKTELEGMVTVRTQALREVNKDLEQAKTELSSLVYRSSHDLRGPMASMLGLLQIIKYDDIPRSTQKYLDLMELSLSKMERVIAEINEIASNTQEQLTFESIKIAPFLSEIIENIEHTEKVQFNLKIAEEMVIQSDKKRLNAVFQHLIRNVVDYRDKEKTTSTCQIFIVSAQDATLIEISDNGIGIPSAYMPRISEMFFRSENSQGSGLGLYIVKQTLALLKGKMEISSQEKEYTTIKLHLPFAA